eukprot:sb/3470506/
MDTTPTAGPTIVPKKQISLPEMSMSEIVNAKTLVTSYREAANFLYRAASELEQLLPTNHRSIKEERMSSGSTWNSPQLAQSHYLQVLTEMLHSKRQQHQAVPPPAPAPEHVANNKPPTPKSFQIESLMGLHQVQDGPQRPMDTTTPTVGPTVVPKKQISLPEMSMSEIVNAKTLVTSYREAANFLYRAASELEQLLPTNHRVF